MNMRNSLLLLTLSCGLAQASSPIPISTPLNPSQEVGPISPSTPQKANGEGVFVYDKTTHILAYQIHFSNLSGAPTMAHFHFGPAHENGPVIQMICGAAMSVPCPGNNSGNVQGTWSVPEQYIQPLLLGKVFVNFHTTLNPAGEIRGQLQIK